MSVLFTAVDTEPREHSEHSWCSINSVNIKCGGGNVGPGWWRSSRSRDREGEKEWLRTPRVIGGRVT